MVQERLQRRLSVIMAADAVGYSQLMGNDEEGTLSALTDCIKNDFEPCIEEHDGRIFKTAGDALLVEFKSVVDAVRCALKVQAILRKCDTEICDGRRLQFRIGINLGDVILRGDDLFGDGVNIAARLEGLAEPGGLCLSEDAYRQVRGKVSCEFDDLGPQRLKNIRTSVRVYQARLDRATSSPPSVSSISYVAPTLPGKPAIAVLPFTNMSGNAEEEYFADGITEDIITELARFQGIFVIARNSVFTYKGRSVRVEDVGRDLGVHYVVEGSVRKAGNRVRVTVQLIKVDTGSHIWAERYDRELADIFDLQDELTQTIVGALPGRVESADIERIKRKAPQDMGAYECVLRAKCLHHRGGRDDNAAAMRLLDHAISIDPEFAPAYAWRGCTLGQAMARGYAPADKPTDDKVYADVLNGLALDANDVECLRILCEFRIVQRECVEALRLNEKALGLNPNNPQLHAQRGEVLFWAGRPEEGVECVRFAMRLDPYEADAWAHLLGRNLYDLSQYAEAADSFKRVPRPVYWHHAYLAVCHEKQGDSSSAEAARAECLRLKPDFSSSAYCSGLFYQDCSNCERLCEEMKKAQLPD